jgi:hypothetical protein
MRLGKMVAVLERASRIGGGEVEQLTPRAVIIWWEIRRLLFNLVLLVVGLVAILGFEWIMNSAIPPGQDAEEPLGLVAGALVYAFLANCCYTLGWVSELAWRKRNPVEARRMGIGAYRLGLLFSACLTTLPFWFACAFWILHSLNPSYWN